jgi:glycosyltransferase involved in cell wall biosynthesis
MSRKRALFLINSLAGGGAERVMCTLLAHSTAEREEFDIVLGLLDDEPAAYAPPDWVEVRQFDCGRSFTRSVAAVRELVRELRPDVTLSFLTRSNMANVLNASSACVISERANTSAHFGPGLSGAASRALVRTLYPRADRVIAVSEGVADDLRDNFGVSAQKLAAIPNPVDVEAILAKAQAPPAIDIGAPYILAAGRLVKSKNFEMLIRAFAAAALEGRKLLILGEGPERDALARVAADANVADRVVMPGFIANPYPLMGGADVFVLSSNAEGFPNGLVEAMAVGAPVIATNCASGPSEILAETKHDAILDTTFAAHGVVVPPNSASYMAGALRAMADPELRRSYSVKAAARARAYGAAVAKDRYWAVLREAMAAKR